MKIKALSIQNFLSISSAAIPDLSSMGLTLIQGENRDDPSAESNGAGKSSTVDAICWCLYGETARGVKGDDVINNVAGKGCAVALTIEDGNETYAVKRFRKHPQGKNKLVLYRMKPTKEDLTQGTTKATQDLVEKVVGCSYNVFKAGVYSGQEQMPDLPAMTDKALKELVEEAAGIDRLQDAHEVARQKYRDAERLCVARDSAATAAETTVQMLEVQVEQAAAREKDWTAALAEEIKRAESAVVSAQREADQVGDQSRIADGIDKAKALREQAMHHIATANDELDKKIAELKQAEDAAFRERQRVHGELIKIEVSVKAKEKTLAEQRAKMIAMRDARDAGSAVDPCGACGRAMSGDEIANALSIGMKALKALNEDCKSSRAEHATKLADFQNTVVTHHESLSEQVRELESKRKPPDMSGVNKIDETLAKLQEAHRKADVATASLKRAITKVEELKAARCPHSEAHDHAKRDLAQHKASVDKIKKDLEKLKRDEELCESAMKVFSPSGVRAHILDTVTPFLNERTAHYLGALSDGAITATWSTVGMTKQGALREQFGIEVVNAKGAKQFQALSGGEKRKVRLATAMALQDLVATRATKPIDLFVADEIDDALDAAGLERLMGLLEQKARERGTVLIVSHNSLRDWIRDVMLVVKENGASTIEMAA